MVTKMTIIGLVQQLLNSAKARNSEQGIPTYHYVLRALSVIESDEEIKSVLVTFNRALASIEAHGYFTPEEIRWVEMLQDMENSINQ